MEDTYPILSTLVPEGRDRRIALTVLLVSLAAFLAAAPFAKEQLTPVAAFIPVYESSLVVLDLVTVALLCGQYFSFRSRALLMLASGYLFTALMTVAHAFTFPGLFAPAGLLGAGPQSTAWLYMFWHGGFPLFVMAYARLRKTDGAAPASKDDLLRAALASFAAVLAAVVGLTQLATAGQPALPAIMTGHNYTPAMIAVVSSVWALSLMALVQLWRLKPRSVLDLWLMIVMCAWLIDIALSAVLNQGRFDLGFYAGRIYGLLAASFVLMVLLLENGTLYARLADSHARERGRSADLRQLAAQLEAANDQLAEKNQQLGEASRLKSEFLANMSHELRTPLNAIIGFSEVLRDGLLGEITAQQREYVNDIFVSGQHLLALINDILDLSKIEAGKMTLDLAPLDADAVLRNSLSIVKEKAASHRIQLQFEAADTLGSALLDERKVKQILYNLLSNGVKFTRDGGRVALRARKVERSTVEAWTDPAATALRMPLPPGDCATFLEILVEDTGIGISADDAPQLFHAFSQLDSSLARETEGTGLGLVLVLKLALLHGGTVALASTPGQGSRMTVWLPWREAAAVARQARPRVAGGMAAPGRPLALVIEDNERAVELVRRQLEPEGFEIVHAASARAGLDLLAQRPPAVVILDILLPDMDGWDLLNRIRQDGGPTAHIPVVIVSIIADRQKGLSLGAAATLQKPVSREDLLAVMADLGLASPKQPVTVLVVDDDPKAVELVCAYLAAPGYRVLKAYGGSDGIATARREIPDVIVLDLMMPEVSGFDLVDALKVDRRTAAIPIVVVTAKTLTAEDRASLNGSVAGILEKASFSHADFIGEVRRALAVRAAGAAA